MKKILIKRPLIKRPLIKKPLIKKKFNIRNYKAKLLCFVTFSNIYLCLLDCNKKSIITKTAGNCKVSPRHIKREKMALHNVLKIVYNLKPYFELYSIKYIDLYFRGFIKRPLIYLLKDFLERYGIKIVSYNTVLSTPHNGMRKRTKRRV